MEWKGAVNFFNSSSSTGVTSILTHQMHFMEMLQNPDGDDFYSRSDLRMLIDDMREKARRLLISAYCKRLDAKNVDDSQRLVLHGAVLEEMDPKCFSLLIQDCKDMAMVTAADDNMSLPIHIACQQNHLGLVHCVSMLLTVYPNSVKCRDSEGRLPLHMALLQRSQSFHANVDAILWKLAEMYPASLTLPFLPTTKNNCKTNDKNEAIMTGFLPFHMACCCNDASTNSIYQLLRAYPLAVTASIY